MNIQERLFTAEDLETLPDDGNQYELSRGELIVMPPPTRTHALVVMRISALLHAYVEAHDLGEVIAEAGYYLAQSPDTVRAPDVSFTAKGRIPPLTGKYDKIPPDLAVEVASPGNTTSDMLDKIEQYFEAGVHEVWVLYPNRRVIYVYKSPDTVNILRGEAKLDGGEVLSGFTAKLNEVFGRAGRR